MFVLFSTFEICSNIALNKKSFKNVEIYNHGGSRLTIKLTNTMLDGRQTTFNQIYIPKSHNMLFQQEVPWGLYTALRFCTWPIGYFPKKNGSMNNPLESNEPFIIKHFYNLKNVWGEIGVMTSSDFLCMQIMLRDVLKWHILEKTKKGITFVEIIQTEMIKAHNKREAICCDQSMFLPYCV